MYYAVCWLDTSDRKYVKGWSLHQNSESAENVKLKDLKGSTAHTRTPHVYKVNVSDEAFDEDFFMGILMDGFAYVEESEPKWLRGDSSTSSKTHVGD